jgi:cell division protein FtsN
VNGTVGDVSVKSEDVNLINGEGIKAFSVVVGSFTLQANAEGLQAQLKQAGYSAQIVQNPVTKMFRVVASTFADKNDAVSSRNTLRASYPQAWLLYKK